MEGNRYDIHIFQYIQTLFLKTEKPKTLTLEEWNSLSYVEKVDNIKCEMQYYKKRWVGYYILHDIFKHLSFISILINILLFSDVNIWYFLSIIFFTFSFLWILKSIVYGRYRSNMMEYRSFEFFILNPEYIV